jgi:hypothetical protein
LKKCKKLAKKAFFEKIPEETEKKRRPLRGRIAYFSEFFTTPKSLLTYWPLKQRGPMPFLPHHHR